MMRVAAIVVFLPLLVSCDDSSVSQDPPRAVQLTGGTPSRGREAMVAYGCTSCHTVPGIRGANALVGPPLDHMASRTYIAGVMSNTPGNMLKWIKDPPAVDDKTAMPNLHVADTDARDIAAYIYTLK